MDSNDNVLYMGVEKAHVNPDAIINVQYGSIAVQSKFKFGITHTHDNWNIGNSEAVARATELLRIFPLHNTHIMSWGPPQLQTDQDGHPVLNNASNNGVNDTYGLQRFVKRCTDLGECIMTLCKAPYWMTSVGTGYANETFPSGDSYFPLLAFEEAFATLCADIADNFPQVKYFQFWNEMKDLVDAQQTSVIPNDTWGRMWQYARYTRVYNLVWDKIKAVRPDAEIFGMYEIGMENNSQKYLGQTHSIVKYVVPPYNANTLYGINGFFNGFAARADGIPAQEATHGVDRWCLDRTIFNLNHPYRGKVNDVGVMLCTPSFGDDMQKLNMLLPSNMPIVWSEFYGLLGDNGVSGGASIEQYAAAQYASIFKHVIENSAGRETWMLLWLEKGINIPMNRLFTWTDTVDGGYPMLLWWVMKAYMDYFANHAIYSTSCNYVDVECIVSSENIALLINKRNTPVKVNINTSDKVVGVSLPVYGTVLIDLNLAHTIMCTVKYIANYPSDVLNSVGTVPVEHTAVVGEDVVVQNNVGLLGAENYAFYGWMSPSFGPKTKYMFTPSDTVAPEFIMPDNDVLLYAVFEKTA
jgi:hypothetical protein